MFVQLISINYNNPTDFTKGSYVTTSIIFFTIIVINVDTCTRKLFYTGGRVKYLRVNIFRTILKMFNQIEQTVYADVSKL